MEPHIFKGADKIRILDFLDCFRRACDTMGLGSVTHVVNQVYETTRAIHERKVALSSVAIYIRLSHCTVKTRTGCKRERRLHCTSPDSTFDEPTRHHEENRKGELGTVPTHRASWWVVGEHRHVGLRVGYQGKEGPGNGKKDAETRPSEPTYDSCRFHPSVLWGMCVTFFGASTCPVFHSIIVLRSWNSRTKGPGRTYVVKKTAVVFGAAQVLRSGRLLASLVARPPLRTLRSLRKLLPTIQEQFLSPRGALVSSNIAGSPLVAQLDKRTWSRA